MTITEFKDSLKQPSPPSQLSNLLHALWYDAKGDWDAAHNVAQDIHSRKVHGSMLIYTGRKAI
jgi:hypothetical protein